jgi:hypothetical protein
MVRKSAHQLSEEDDQHYDEEERMQTDIDPHYATHTDTIRARSILRSLPTT